MLHGRKRTATFVATLIVLLTALVTVGIGLTSTATAKPDLETVKKQVEELEHQAEAASERYNDAQVKADETQVKLSAVNADLRRQQATVEEMREQVAEMIVDQYQGNSLSTASQVILSDDPDAFLDNLGAVASYNSQRGQVLKAFSTELNRLELRQDAVKSEADRLVKLEKRMKADKAEIDTKSAKAQKVLDTLEADARAELLGGEYAGALPSVAASGRAAAAVRWAMAQVGKSYVYGAAGPNSFDCSGLTMRAWEAAGVSLPHFSGAQMSLGTRVSRDALQPGDLVFYYSPVSHVGMYIGNGLLVNAQNPRSGVQVVDVDSMPYVGAVRPG